MTVPAGTAHKFWNAGDDEAHFVCEVRPALQFEQLMPNPLRLAVIARHHFDDVRLPFPPMWAQRMGLALGAPVGRVAGLPGDVRPGGGGSAQPVTESV